MNKNSIGPILKKRFVNNKVAKSFLYKSIFTLAVLLLVFLLTKINTNQSNRLLETVKTNINYEFHIRDDSVRVYNKARDVFNFTLESIPVFNTDQKLESPVSGTVFRTFDSQIKTIDGVKNNGGIEIRLEDEKSPISLIDGRVTNIQKRDNKGYFVTVEEDNIKIIYGYLESTQLNEGDLVGKGDIIGEVGINKDGSRYLRLELYIEGELVDPEKYIDI